MQWVAMITMLIDHIGIVWFPDSPIWRIVGRIAFPVYTYLIAVGLSRTRSVPKYLLRLALLAVISQAPFALLFDTYTINVIGTFFVSAAAVYGMERWKDNPLGYAFPIAAAVLLEAVAFDYGAYGLLLLLIFRYTTRHVTLLSHFGLNIIYVLLFQAPLQVFSILPTLVVAYAPSALAKASYRAPSWLWRSFYPAHLIVLYILAITLFRP
ncbi:conjugal transfer protein TraX [Paenibacillus antri]|uniref:Conjugal transfer protein TraX n=1 Tax=Paenibacillus antri TaxID=2582848 RepID=A0A5R9G8S6_9BACL|nr:TraX family protein [Paenibacillus antri]TLS50500.1 conjugal transfer protein TraX [Paenibacillus antri]